MWMIACVWEMCAPAYMRMRCATGEGCAVTLQIISNNCPFSLHSSLSSTTTNILPISLSLRHLHTLQILGTHASTLQTVDVSNCPAVQDSVMHELVANNSHRGLGARGRESAREGEGGGCGSELKCLKMVDCKVRAVCGCSMVSDEIPCSCPCPTPLPRPSFVWHKSQNHVNRYEWHVSGCCLFKHKHRRTGVIGCRDYKEIYQAYKYNKMHQVSDNFALTLAGSARQLTSLNLCGCKGIQDCALARAVQVCMYVCVGMSLCVPSTFSLVLCVYRRQIRTCSFTCKHKHELARSPSLSLSISSSYSHVSAPLNPSLGVCARNMF